MNNYELEHLRYELRKAHEENERLRIAFDSEQWNHASTRRQYEELQAARERAYDAYITNTHEGYIPQEDYDEIEQKYETLISCVVSFMELEEE